MSAARSLQRVFTRFAARLCSASLCSTSGKQLVEVSLAVALAFLLAAMVVRLIGTLHAPVQVLLAVSGIGLGVLLTDFISGLVHWLCDTYGDEQTRWLGPLLIAPFREHHRYPQRMLERSFLEVNLSNSVGSIAVILVALGAERFWPGDPSTPLGQGFLFGLALAIYLTNTFHQWAHAPKAPRLARALQRSRLAIDPRRHAPHHARGHGTYCITTGWLNPCLDRFEIFPRTERLLARLSLAAAPPARDPGDPRGRT